jgi:hypothetical protein
MKYTYLILIILSLLANSCQKEGCTNPLASNFDINAQAENGTCYYLDEVKLPKITTTPLIYSNTRTASCGGEINNKGGGEILEMGICWSTNFGPTIEDHFRLNKINTYKFTANLIDLSLSQTYYVRAYARNSKGISYGNQLSFTTADYITGSITTLDVIDISATSATSGISFYSSSSYPSTPDRGICWSTNSNPTRDDNFSLVTASGSVFGEFPVQLTNLSATTLYHTRAFVTTANGTAYGNDIEFTTAQNGLQIGDSHEGGIIFYLDATGNHGLICAINDFSSTSAWGCNGMEINGADDSDILTGAQNTIDIESGCSTPSTAADVCSNSSLNGYTDWFLPSVNELKYMRTQKDIINSNSLSAGGNEFDNSQDYWSSTESTPFHALSILFSSNNAFNLSSKSSAYLIRPVRQF